MNEYEPERESEREPAFEAGRAEHAAERARAEGMPEEVELAPPRSLPPDVAEPGVAAASAEHESDEESDLGLSPSGLPSAGPHPAVALPLAASTPRQLIGLLGAPIVWAAQLQARYSLGTMNCGDDARLSLHLVSLAALVLAAACGSIAWRAWRAIGETWPEDAGGPPGRTRFVAATGVIVSAGFFLVILAQAIPSFFFPICR